MSVYKLLPGARADFERRLREFRSRPRQASPEQVANAEQERGALKDWLSDDLDLVTRKMEAIGGSAWALAEIEKVRVRAAANAAMQESDDV